MAGSETEPNGWELLRGIKDLKEAVERATGSMVAGSTFALYQAAIAKEISDNKAAAAADVANLRADYVKDLAAVKAEVADVQTQLDEQKKSKARLIFAVVTTAIGAAGSLIVGLVLFMVTKGGTTG